MPHPFLEIFDSGPFARVREARLVNRNAEEVFRAFLLLQKDRYYLPSDVLHPFSNLDIEKCWQKTFQFHIENGPDRSRVPLFENNPSEDASKLIPFRSLFFCKQKEVFFHPICPVCGDVLDLCNDDAILIRSKLSAYSASTKRYLFCEKCYVPEGNAVFYALEIDGGDPLCVKDLSGLIKDFVTIAENNGQPDQFPCRGCTSGQECYGPLNLALTRIVPFGFYPFFMLAFDAMSVNAIDFIALISGASFEDLEKHLVQQQASGRIHCLNLLRDNNPANTRFFFPENDRYFLEVLYLKLTFMMDIVRQVLPRINALTLPYPTLDRIWVNFPDQGGSLPFFWDFHVKLMEMSGVDDRSSAFSEKPYSSGGHFLGLVWLYTFFVNSKQNVPEIYDTVEKALAQAEKDPEKNYHHILENLSSTIFNPENIFWNPESRSLQAADPAWMELWMASLEMGWSLVTAGKEDSSNAIDSRFMINLDALRLKVKDQLFSPKDVNFDDATARENRSIQEILSKIEEKWKKQETSPSDGLEKRMAVPLVPVEISGAGSQQVSDEADLDQTVVLSSGQPAVKTELQSQDPSPAKDVTFEAPEKDTNGFPETVSNDDGDVGHTVMITSTISHTEPEPMVPEEDDLDKTVILSSRNPVKDVPFQDPEHDGLDATVIISHNALKSESPPVLLPEDDMPQTVVINREDAAKAAGNNHPIQTEKSGDEMMPETVILGSRKKREEE